MGWSTDPNAAHEPLTLVQTPENVKAVRLRAGYLTVELSYDSGIAQNDIFMAENGKKPLSNRDWLVILKVCGMRTFDKE